MPDASLQSWRPSSAWDVVAIEPGRYGAETTQPGVTFELLEHRDLATFIERNDRSGQLSDVMSKRFGFPLPEVRQAAFGERGAVVWSAPHQWLAVAPHRGDLAGLHEALRDIAAVTDQGDGRALVRIKGPAARRMLSKSIAIDLHPDVFSAGHAATVAMAHVSVQLWAEDDAPTFVFAIPRTMAGSIWRNLTASAAEFGYDVLFAS